jgi:hypothetical protein
MNTGTAVITADTAVQPFRAEMADEAISDLRRRIAASNARMVMRSVAWLLSYAALGTQFGGRVAGLRFVDRNLAGLLIFSAKSWHCHVVKSSRVVTDPLADGRGPRTWPATWPTGAGTKARSCHRRSPN